jgi:lipoate-protein ligase A
VSWHVVRVVDTVANLHALGVPENPVRTIRVCEPTDRALVLGRAQPESDVDMTALLARANLVRRQSGGGAVLVEPGDLVWFDVIIPKGDPLWSDDVGKAFHWLGDVLADVLGGEAHKGALVTNEWSRIVCFASLGPGEVTEGGKKIAGISQRRTRNAAWFQVSVPKQFDSERIASLLNMERDQRNALVSFLDDHVGTVPAFSVLDVIGQFGT